MHILGLNTTLIVLVHPYTEETEGGRLLRVLYNLVMNQELNGVINHSTGTRKTDYLFRLSLNGIVMNDAGQILFVKEDGRDWWDLPGGGMDHGEDIKSALAREMREEVNLNDGFEYQIIYVDEPKLLEHIKAYQVRLFFIVKPENMEFSPGEDGDELAFMSIDELREVDEPRAQLLQKILSSR